VGGGPGRAREELPERPEGVGKVVDRIAAEQALGGDLVERRGAGGAPTGGKFLTKRPGAPRAAHTAPPRGGAGGRGGGPSVRRPGWARTGTVPGRLPMIAATWVTSRSAMERNITASRCAGGRSAISSSAASTARVFSAASPGSAPLAGMGVAPSATGSTGT